MARTRRQATNADEEFSESKEEWLRRTDEERKVHRTEREVRRGIKTMNLVQTALAGVVSEYVTPDHQPGEQFPGRQPPTTQLSLFDAGFKRQFQWDNVADGWVPRHGPMC